MDDQQPALPPARPGDAARGARGQGDRHAGDAGAVRRGVPAPGPAFTEGEGTLTVTPPSWRFDLKIEEDLIEEVIRVIGYDKLPTTRAAGAGHGRACGRSRRSSARVRRALAALDYQETINFSFVEARWEQELAGNADPIRVLNPIAAPLAVMRSSLMGSLVQVLRHNLARKAPRVRCSSWAACSCAMPSVADGRLSVAGVRQPMRVAAWPMARPTAAVGRAERAVDFFDVKGDVEALLAPRAAARLRGRRAPGFAPGPLRRGRTRRRAIGHVGELHPRGARPTSCRRRRCCSNWTWTPCWPARCRPSAGAAPAGRPCATWRWWCARARRTTR
jgi:phenylalanyl-tRNA synthetase beta chain